MCKIIQGRRFESLSSRNTRAAAIRLTGLLLVVAAQAAFVSSNLRGQLLTSTAAQAGMQRTWRAQIELAGPTDYVAYVTTHISSSEGTVLYELEYKGGKQRLSSRDTDGSGVPYGPAGIKRRLDAKVLLLKQAKLEPKFTKTVVPVVFLVSVTRRGSVQCLDGESGATLWKMRIGNPRHIVFPPAVNDAYTSVLSGMRLYLIRNRSGRIRWQKKLANLPGAGATMTADHIYVPLQKGRIDAFPIKASSDLLLSSHGYFSVGSVIVPTTVTPRTISWPSMTGQMWVGNAKRGGLRYRLEGAKNIVSQVRYAPGGRLISTSLDGFVTCLDELSGRVIWRTHTNRAISQSALILDQRVFIITDRGSLIALALDDGRILWSSPNIKSFVAASPTRLYCWDPLDKLVLLSRATGGRLAALDAPNQDLPLLNLATDRLYLGSRRGRISCYREYQLEWPVAHVNDPDPTPEEDAKGKAAAPGAAQPGAAQPGAAQPGAKGAPPAAANPFGGGGAAGPANPFGGGGGGGAGGAGAGGAGANPFGGPPPKGAPAKGAAPANNPFGN